MYQSICIKCSAIPSALQIECAFPCYVALSPAVTLSFVISIVSATGGASTPSTPAAATCNGVSATHTGTPGDDRIIGTEGRDVIDGLAGDDYIEGLGGDDLICGGEGRNYLGGNNGAAIMYGGEGIDSISGFEGDDIMYGGGGDDEKEKSASRRLSHSMPLPIQK
jgi:RTX calcium-binding nonapeptide repeat (4 copies)